MLYSHRQMGPPQNIGKNEDAINNFAVAWTVHKQVDEINGTGISSPKKDESKLPWHLIVTKETFLSDFCNSTLYIMTVNKRYYFSVTKIQCGCACACMCMCGVCVEWGFIRLKRVNQIQGCSLEKYGCVRCGGDVVV